MWISERQKISWENIYDQPDGNQMEVWALKKEANNHYLCILWGMVASVLPVFEVHSFTLSATVVDSFSFDDRALILFLLQWLGTQRWSTVFWQRYSNLSLISNNLLLVSLLHSLGGLLSDFVYEVLIFPEDIHQLESLQHLTVFGKNMHATFLAKLDLDIRAVQSFRV